MSLGKKSDMIVEMTITWADGDIQFINLKNSFALSGKDAWHTGLGVLCESAFEWSNLEVAGSIPTTGNNNKEYFYIFTLVPDHD